ncbi:hypothetical protein CJF32_00005780 [Rutstroemia sp. NJR-2017a WRK4]|nr:hypothetical protein CJF32_00005780 [Rutstroemia sp. NJR-2017a WRK4]
MYTEPGEIMETDQSEEASGTGGVPDLPPMPLNVQERLIAVASTCGIRASDVQDSFGKQLSYIKDRYPRDTLQWQQWLAGSKFWEANLQEGRDVLFMIKEREVHQGESCRDPGPLSDQDNRVVDAIQGDTDLDQESEGSKSSRGAVQVSSTDNGRGSGVKSNLKLEFATGPHLIKPPGYRTNESTMEKKAVSLNCRREFFVCLQKNRDLAKKQHRDCDQNYRGWLADRLTWQTMFKGPFPWLSEEPVVEHSNNCVNSTARASKNGTNPARVLPDESRFIVGLPCRLRNQMTNIPPNSSGVIKDNTQIRPISSARSTGTFKSKTTFYQPMIHVNNKEIPCPGKFGLLCDVFSREIRADTLVQTELGCSIHFGAEMETIHLYSTCSEGVSADQSSKRKLVLRKADAFLEAWATECADGSIGLTDCWRMYHFKGGGSALDDLEMDVDVLLKEEAAKVEGSYRKVFDEVSGKVVPLKDYEIMIRTRSLNAAYEATSTSAINVGALKDISSGQGNPGGKF